MTRKGVEAELKRLLEEDAGHLDCRQMGGTSYPISTARLPKSAVMPLKSTTESLEREVNQDFFSSDNVIIPKKTIKKRSFNNYSPTKVKVRNFLTNISYNRVKDDFNNRSLIIDCYSFILLYLNPFYLDRKFENSVEKDYVEVLWQLQIPNDFYVLICRPKNYKILNKLKLKFQETSEIVKTYADDLIGYQQLQTSFKKNGKVIQYVYANLFPRYFC